MCDLGEYLVRTGDNDAALAALERAVELVPAEPPSPERAYALGSLAGGLMVDWRHRSRCRSPSRRSRSLGVSAHARQRSERSPCSACDLAYLGRDKEGLAHLRQALQLAEEIGDHIGLERAYVNFTDALTMLGRPRESARLGREGLEAMRRYGIHSALLVSNLIEALLAIGEWDEADRLSAAALRGITSSFPYALLIIRADVEIGRGEFDAAQAHLEAARATLRADRGHGLYDSCVADLALWERRWTDADAAIDDGPGLARASARRHRSASGSAPRDCARRRSWPRSRAPAGTPTRSATGSIAPRS